VPGFHRLAQRRQELLVSQPSSTWTTSGTVAADLSQAKQGAGFAYPFQQRPPRADAVDRDAQAALIAAYEYGGSLTSIPAAAAGGRELVSAVAAPHSLGLMISSRSPYVRDGLLRQHCVDRRHDPEATHAAWWRASLWAVRQAPAASPAARPAAATRSAPHPRGRDR